MTTPQEKEKENNYDWPKDFTRNDINFLKELLQYLKNLDEWKYFHEDVNLKGRKIKILLTEINLKF